MCNDNNKDLYKIIKIRFFFLISGVFDKKRKESAALCRDATYYLRRLDATSVRHGLSARSQRDFSNYNFAALS
jgi:hypothetical protein